MPCYNRMKRIFLQGLLWLYLFGFGFMALSLEPGFLDFDNLPDTNFTCVGKVIGGYYADLETNCQMFHVCTIGQLDEPMDIRFLCLNGTVFDQETRVCERIDEVDCSKSEQFYSLNLELYGNTQLTNLEENSETEQPLIIKSTPSTTSTTTTEPPKKTTKFSYFTTIPPPKISSTLQNRQVLSHHFPVVNPNSADIRFNPEEINISLNPGAPPDIRTKHFFSEKKVTSSDKKIHVVTSSDSDKQSTGTSAQKSGYSLPRPSDIIEYSFEEEDGGYGTETLPQEYHFHKEYRPSQEYSGPLHNPNLHSYKATTFRTDYVSTTQKIPLYHQKSSTTSRSYYIQSLKPPITNHQSHYIQHRTEKPPQRLQLPLPLLPTLSPLTFSSPAPFALQHHIETKRYTKEHVPPPRIVVSASASVSDASGRRLNYSLGTIGAAQLLGEPPSSYDDYKETDVGLDPFYHDVPKLKQAKRKKRSTDVKIKHSDIIKNDEEAVNVLKFLFDWYRNEKTNPARYTTTPLNDPLPIQEISKINDELGQKDYNGDISKHTNESDVLDFTFKNSDLFNKNSKYSIIGENNSFISEEGQKNGSDIHGHIVAFDTEQTYSPEDYVDDNYEPETYKENYEKSHYHVDNTGFDRKESKKYSVTLDYVDDNVEPIYYKERYPNSFETNKDYILRNTFRPETNFKLKPEPSILRINDVKDVSNLYLTKQDTETTEETIGIEQSRIEASTASYIPHIENHKNSIENKYQATERSEEYLKDNEEIDKNEEMGQVEINFDDKSYKPVIKTEVSFVTKITEEEDLRISSTTPSILPVALEEDQTSPKENYIEIMNLTEVITPSTATQNSFENNAISKSLETKHESDDAHSEIKPVRPTNLIRTRNGTRGRRRYNTVESTTREPVTIKSFVIEKLIKKPYTAKDDYDFLRTLSNVHSSTTKTSTSEDHEHNFTIEDDNYTLSHDNYSFSFPNIASHTLKTIENFSSPEEMSITETVKPTEELITEDSVHLTLPELISSSSSTTTTTTTAAATTATTTSTTTEQPKPRNNRRRGHTRNHGETNHKSGRRRKGHVHLENKEKDQINTPLSSNGNQYAANFHDIHTSASKTEEFINNLPSLKSLVGQIEENNPIIVDNNSTIVENNPIIVDNNSVIVENHIKDIDDSFRNIALTSEVITTTTTTEHLPSSVKNRARGSKTFLSEVNINHKSDVVTQTPEVDTTQTTPLVYLVNLENLGTPGYPSTEPLLEVSSTTGNPISQQNSSSQIDNIEEIYATLFVPTEAIHITKKKQLKERILIDTEATLDRNDELTTTEEGKIEVTTMIPKYTEYKTVENKLDIVEDFTTTLPNEKLGKEINAIKQTSQDIELPTTLWSETTTPQIEEQTNIVKSDLNETEITHITPKLIIEHETETPMWITENLETFIKEVETTTKSVVASADKIVTKIDTSTDNVAENFNSTLKYYHHIGTAEVVKDNELIGEIPDKSQHVFLKHFAKNSENESTVSSETTTVENINNVTSSEETTTDLTVLEPETLPVTQNATVSETVTDKTRNTEIPTTIELTTNKMTSQVEPYSTTQSLRGSRGKHPKRRPSNHQRRGYQHRFSTEQFTRRPENRRTTIEDEIIDVLISKTNQLTTEVGIEVKEIEEYSTNAPLWRSAHPTQGNKRDQSLPTTPLSRRMTVKKHYFFNCFNKDIDKFYADPRDCRLFHYCTQGYSKNQLLDMKFVCDLNTYFDDENLICTKKKPKRCL